MRHLLLVTVLIFGISPTILHAQEEDVTEREQSLAKLVHDERNEYKFVPLIDGFQELERLMTALYSDSRFSNPTNGGDDVQLTEIWERIMSGYTRDQMVMMLAGLAVYRDFTFFHRERFTLAIQLFGDDGEVYAAADSTGRLSVCPNNN